MSVADVELGRLQRGLSATRRERDAVVSEVFDMFTTEVCYSQCVCVKACMHTLPRQLCVHVCIIEFV